MKTTGLYTCLVVITAGFILASGCKKKNEESVSGPVPSVMTGNYNNVLLNTLEITGSVSDNYGFIVTGCGFCWSNTSQDPRITDDTLMIPVNFPYSFSGIVKRLKGQTTYYIRAFATNMNGTGYGTVVPVTTIDSTVSDIDNNDYRLVQIGAQVWMAENLKTTRFNDGSNIPLVVSIDWNTLTTPAYCWYNDDITNKVTYGALYNWYAANSGNLAPAGFHVPTINDWLTLVDLLGGPMKAGGPMKEAGLAHWNAPNYGATNSSGFTALPGGERNPTDDFVGFGDFGVWWSSSESGSAQAYINFIPTATTQMSGFIENPVYGGSIRCIKN